MGIVDFSFPSTEQAIKGTGVNLAFRFGMQTAKPFKISETIGNTGNPEFTSLKDLEGRPWLTSLALAAEKFNFVFEEVIITINQEKNIVTTALQGRDGTIKEYVSDGDYSITIDAGISNYSEGDETGDSLEYPIDKIEELIKFLSLKKEIAVQNDFLKLFEIDTIVVKSYNLMQETHSNRQSINIQALSDSAYEIKIKNDDTAL